MVGRNVIDEYGNEWSGVESPPSDVIAQAAVQLNLDFRAEVAEFLRRFAGGTPKRDEFYSERYRMEVGIGRVHGFSDNGLVDRTVILRQYQGLPAELLPIAFDRGNANDICVRPDGRIVYYVTDVEDDRELPVADSLSEFLSGLSSELF